MTKPYVVYATISFCVEAENTEDAAHEAYSLAKEGIDYADVDDWGVVQEATQ